MNLFFRYIQAALAPMALDIVRKQNLSDLYGLANTVLIVSVLAIILTAPLGAILMVIEISIFYECTSCMHLSIMTNLLHS